MNKLSKTALYLSLALSIAPKTYADNIDMNTAHLQAMDKITGRVSELNIPVNGLANFGTFSILVRKCVTKSPEETPENTAFIDIVDNYKSSNPTNIFKGWMFSSTPGINGVEHPIYDIWLLKCYNSDRTKHQVLTEEQLKFRDELPMVRPEKQEANINISTIDNINDKEAQNEPTTFKNIEIISENSDNVKNIDIKDTDTTKTNIDKNIINLSDSEETTTEEIIIVEDDFAAEGEEIVTETIIIDNETIAQDEENQKEIEETIKKNTDENKTDKAEE